MMRRLVVPHRFGCVAVANSSSVINVSADGGRFYSEDRGAEGRGRGRGRGGRGRGKSGYRGSIGNVDKGRPLRDAHLDGLDNNRYNSNRNLHRSVKDELSTLASQGVGRNRVLTGELRDARMSETYISPREQAESFAKGRLITKHDPDGVYQPSHRPKRLVMPIDLSKGRTSRAASTGGEHELFNRAYVDGEARQGPSTPTGRDAGGRAAGVIKENRKRSQRRDDGEISGEEGRRVPSGFATTSASYSSTGDQEYVADKKVFNSTDGDRFHTPRGALQAGEVPEERSVADCFRFLLDNCKNLGVLGGGAAGALLPTPPSNSSSSAVGLSCFAQLHQGGGMPVYDPVALPMAYLSKALRRYQSVLEAVAERGEEALLATPVSDSATDPAGTGSAASIVALGNSAHRCSIIPAARAQRKFSRKDVMRLLAEKKNPSASPEKEVEGARQKEETPSSAVMVVEDPFASDFNSFLVQFEKEQQVYRAWDLIEATPLNSPNNGASSQRGKAFVMHYVVHDLVHASFPNCRSRLAQAILHKYALSPLAVINACNEMGLTTFTNYEVEVGLYRESLIAFSHFSHIQRSLAKFHRERFERKNIESNEYHRLKSQLRAARSRLAAFPSDPDTLHLRYKWLEDLLFSFVDFVRRGEGDAAARRIVDHYMAPTLARHQYRRAALEEAMGTMEAVDGLLRTIRASPSYSSSSFVSSAVAGASDVLGKLRDCAVDVLLIGDGLDGHGSIKATDGIQVMQMQAKRHISACTDLCAQLGVAHAEAVREAGDSASSSSTSPSLLSIYPMLREEMDALRTLISSNPRDPMDWGDANSSTSSASSIASAASRALDSILKYHPQKEVAHKQALLMSTSSGKAGIDPFMVDAGGSGLLLDSQGGDDEVMACAMQLQLDSLKGRAVGGLAEGDGSMGQQVQTMRSYMGAAFLPPSTVLATANSSITKPLQELQLLLKYSPSVWLGADAAKDGGPNSAPGARSYALHFEAVRQTSLFEHSHNTIVEEGVHMKQQKFYTATLYLYHYINDDGGAVGGDAAGRESSDKEYPATGSGQHRGRLVKRHVLGTGIGPNLETATHAATMRVLRRFYYKAGVKPI